MGLSNILREQAFTQNQSGQTAPQTPPKVLWPMINAAERLKSDFSICRTAIMKSAGEQSAGQAVLQGFSSQ